MTLLKYIWSKKWLFILVPTLAALLFIAYACFNTYYSANARISLIYPNSEKGYYPDGSRFNMYDILSDDVIEKAVQDYNNEYEGRDLTVQEAKMSTRVNYYLAGAVQDRVQNALYMGQQAAYYTNEYIIIYRPVRIFDIKRPSDLFGVIHDVDSDLFMQKLQESYNHYFMNTHTEMNTIPKITQSITSEDYDYIEIADLYDRKINMYINYLASKNQEDETFRSRVTGVSFNDLITGFQSLKDVKIRNLISFVSSSKITKNVDEVVNKYRTMIERGQLEYRRLQDESDFAAKAMNLYDHTFDGNIVIVGMNEELGLYQSRPRTAFDSITKRSLEAGVQAKDKLNDILEYERLISEYLNNDIPPEEKQRLFEIADGMIAEIDEEYNNLVSISNKTVDDYLIYKCNNFINYTKIPKQYFNYSVAIRAAIVFGGVFVMLLAFLMLFGKKTPILSILRKRKKLKT